MIIVTMSPLDLLQQTLNTPHAKGGHGHGGDGGFDKLVNAQLTNQPVANPQVVAPRQRVEASALKPKKEDRRDRREGDEQDDEHGDQQGDAMQDQPQRQGRSLWA